MSRDVFDYIDDQDAPKRVNRTAAVWNILTVLVLLTAVCVGILFLVVFINPYMGLNPFPPPTLPARIELDTPTPTPKSILPPTWTPQPPTDVPPTEIPIIPDTQTPFPTQSESGGGNEENSGDDMPVVPHEGDNPSYIPSRSFHPELGCSWMGVAGQVIDLTGAPVQGLIIEVGGILDGKNIGNPSLLQATGLAPAYGGAGFEFKLSDEPIPSTGTLWIQVLDQAGLALSDKIYFDTYEDCDKNLIIIIFKQIR
jgi:hypothetical protein